MDLESAVRESGLIGRYGVVCEPEEIAPGVWAVSVDSVDLEKIAELYSPGFSD